MARYDAVFFDLYGTLIDIRTDEWSQAAWEALRVALNGAGADYADADETKRRFDEELARQMAGHEDDRWYEPEYIPVYQRMLAAHGVQAGESEARAVGWSFRHSTTSLFRLYPGALDLLEALRNAGIRTVLVSNAQSSFTRPELELLGLDKALDRILISSEEGTRKPGVELFELALRREGVTADRAVMVGNDTTCDIAGAASAGIDGIYLHTEISPASDPDECAQALLSCKGADYEAVLDFILGRD
ncbi:HAD family hydrolase [Bifidobacterium sp. 64T4]|uniref:HAD family hydrolase n=1 Tax=Bifidobacterium pongonis TaxID=2834432 RepID=UPI001C596438|nr:HAD family hydrolase [Bifidobacterium pongonis]MBW3094635.1 HAD family hydrolase [Bifidobacterium pongonis]